ncbi:MAG: cytochrome P450 [Pseudonocardiaceae bacterium]
MADPDLSDVVGFWALPIEDRAAAFAELRASDTIKFFAEPELGFGSDGPGYYALTRWDDIVEASSNPAVFRSEPTATSISDIPDEMREIFSSMINMDGPRHAQLRRIVSREFAPRRLELLQRNVERVARKIIDDISPRGSCDVVVDISSQFPLRIVCDIMGIPASEYSFVLKRTNVLFGAYEPEYVTSGAGQFASMLKAGRELAELMRELRDLRLKNPKGDLTSVLVNAEIDGQRLTADELASFFVLLVAAGNDTTRNSISWGAWLLSQHPEQRADLAKDPDGLIAGAVDEIVRWASPIIYMRRTLAAPVELSGQLLEAESKVALFYWSANRDERYFTNADAFDIRRSPNPHVAFGGFGPHFCLGAHLARRETTVMLRELLRRLPDLHAFEPVRVPSMFLNGIKHLPAVFTARDGLHEGFP